jgi:hypothetical protein
MDDSKDRPWNISALTQRLRGPDDPGFLFRGGPMIPPSCTHPRRHAATCRWAVPTLLLPAPFWFEAERAPWGCVRGTTPRLLASTQSCADCAFWEPQPRKTTAQRPQSTAGFGGGRCN